VVSSHDRGDSSDLKCGGERTLDRANIDTDATNLSSGGLSILAGWWAGRSAGLVGRHVSCCRRDWVERRREPGSPEL